MQGVREKPYAGKLLDERKAERRRRFVEAGMEILGTPGTSPPSVRSVCREAGLNSRYFYESFASLDELLVAVYDEIAAQGAARMLRAAQASDGTVRGCVAGLLDAFLGMAIEDPRAMRIGYTEAWGSEVLMRRRVESLHECAQWLTSTVIRNATTPPPDRVAVAVAANVVVGGLLQAILGWMDGRLDLDEATLSEAITAAAVGALDQAMAGVSPV